MTFYLKGKSSKLRRVDIKDAINQIISNPINFHHQHKALDIISSVFIYHDCCTTKHLKYLNFKYVETNGDETETFNIIKL